MRQEDFEAYLDSFKSAAKEFLRKLYPGCSVEISKVKRYKNNYKIDAEVEQFNPSRRYNLKIRIKAKVVETPKGKIEALMHGNTVYVT